MIREKEKAFLLETRGSSYIFAVDETNHLEHYYYGPRIRVHNVRALKEKFENHVGTSEYFDRNHSTYVLAQRDLEVSGVGKGDHREAFVILENQDGTYVNDFTYEGYELTDEAVKLQGLPGAWGGKCQTLKISMSDRVKGLTMYLYYTIFHDSDVIVKSSELVNESGGDIIIRRLMSSQLDMPQQDFELLTFDGTWGRERHRHIHNLEHGIHMIDSKTGNSSNEHNPFFIIKKKDANQDYGLCYGMNLIYSGSHKEIIEVNPYNKLRILTGISDYGFRWRVRDKGHFQTPQAVLTVTGGGLNQMSQNMHDFVNHHIVRGYWKNRQRPILANHWEGAYFDFNEAKILGMAKEAAKCGIELFVLDDGWFGDRSDDTKGLGDWQVNKKKLPSGIKGLAEKINHMGMDFGLWLEPEMVNENSDLYRKHPEWAVRLPDREPSLGRHQLVLDFANPQVVEYITGKMTEVISSANISYIKWDMNRNITDMYSSCLEHQGEFLHRYILGLYRCLDQITTAFPKVLFESCASGGNRFDLGMFVYMPQAWCSDNTDAYERYYIQEGTSYGYPLSCMGAHVSACPNHQVIRNTPLETRFNVASFGCLGYELDFKKLSEADRKIIKNQITIYKTMRRTMQYGRFYRLGDAFTGGQVKWLTVAADKKEAWYGLFETLQKPVAFHDILQTRGLQEDALYEVSTREQFHNIRIFGELVNHVMPMKLKIDGVLHTKLCRRICLPTETDRCRVYGDMLNISGIKLSQPFNSCGYNENTRIMGDFGSRIYQIKRLARGIESKRNS